MSVFAIGHQKFEIYIVSRKESEFMTLIKEEMQHTGKEIIAIPNPDRDINNAHILKEDSISFSKKFTN